MTALHIFAMLPLIGLLLCLLDQEWFEFIINVAILVGVIWLFVWGLKGVLA